jgi:hypothetical protein
MEGACQLTSNAIIAVDEYVIREDPESTRVITSLLQKVMQENGTTWKPFATWRSQDSQSWN